MAVSGNLPRVLPDHLAAEVDLDAIDVPAVFSWLAKTGGVAESEMLSTFNCGIGMVVAVAADEAAQIAALLQQAGEHVTMLGQIVPRQAAGVTYRGSLAL